MNNSNPNARVARLRNRRASPVVPPEHRALYDHLSAILREFEPTIPPLSSNLAHKPAWSGALATANPNLGSTLLDPASIAINKRVLNGLQSMGFRGVTVEINYPLFEAAFTVDAPRYLDFYKRIADEIRRRGMQMHVETQSVLDGYTKLPVRAWYDNLTPEDYVMQKGRMLKTIVEEIEPDTLTIDNEPDTNAANLGLPINHPYIWQQIVNYFLDTIGETEIPLGAGFGSWIEEPLTWADSLRLTDIDFFNFHVYPIDAGFLEVTRDLFEFAKVFGKKVAVHEGWLYKWQEGNPGGMATSPEIYSLDPFAFWAELDKSFITIIYALCQACDGIYFAPFWSNLFGSYLDYDQTRYLSPMERIQRGMAEGIIALMAGRLSPTGVWLRETMTTYNGLPDLGFLATHGDDKT